MNCMYCGSFLQDRGLDYCQHCGANIRIQKKAVMLSKYHYNLGLEKAQIRDLSGAIACLRLSLTFDKENIQARNLLGLVYFETGEVVEALSEWVISKNVQPNRNLASEYIQRLQANQSRLDAINETIRKYNEALSLTRQRHEDMASIRLRRLLAQNPKLIKGYHLLALILMKNQEWGKARRILRKAARIDKTNTTTLRFLREIEGQIGISSRSAQAKQGLFGRSRPARESDDILGESPSLPQAPAGGGRTGSRFLALILGIAAGAAACYLLAVPGIRQNIYRQANRQIVRYSESVSSQSAELSRAQGQARESDDTAQAISAQLVQEKQKSASYQALLEAYRSLQEEDYDSAALSVQQVYEATLTEEMRGIYGLICSRTGVYGISSDSASDQEEEDEEEDEDW